MKGIFTIFVLTLSAFAFSACEKVEPQKVVFDTDMGNDIDDAIALAMLFNYEKNGLIDLAAVAVNKANPNAPAYVKMFADYYGRGNLPICFVGDGKTPEEGIFVRKGLENRGLKADSFGDFPKATEFLRKILADSKDKSLVYVSVGFSTNLARLLDSKPDAISPLTGKELFAKKVKYISAMAGEFKNTVSNPNKPQYEYNVTCDIPSAKAVFENCPVPIIFSGFEIGIAVEYPHSKVKSNFAADNPLVYSYELYARHVNKGKDGEHNRPSWDLTSVLYVVSPDSFSLSPTGDVKVTEKGATIFTPNKDGLRRYLILDKEHTASAVLEKLVNDSAQK